MWSIKELKTKAKEKMHANYWKAILVGMVLTMVVGSGGGGVSSVGNTFNGGEDSSEILEENELYYDEEPGDYYYDGTTDEYYFDDGSVAYFLDRITNDLDTLDMSLLATIFAFLMIFVVLVVLLVVLPLQILVLNPLEVGCRRFFTDNLKDKAQVKAVCYAFDNNYKTTIKTVFFKQLYTFLWSLLLVIPGIVKSYEYRMIPYLLSNHPEMTSKEIFEESKRLMTGNKWKAFVLDLSFIGWYILSGLTLGILGIFYVNPYHHQTSAALYEALTENNNFAD